MSEADRERWEKKHRGRHADPSEPALASLDWIPPARSRERSLALDIACGRGRHCGPLLRAGYRVVAADIARAALSHVSRVRPESRDRLLLVQADLDDWPFGEKRFDVIVQTNFLDRGSIDSIKRSTKPGGYVLVDTFLLGRAKNAEGPSNPHYLLRPHELEREFASWEVLRIRTQGPPTARQAMLARRPAAAAVGGRRR